MLENRDPRLRRVETCNINNEIEISKSIENKASTVSSESKIEKKILSEDIRKKYVIKKKTPVVPNIEIPKKLDNNNNSIQAKIIPLKQTLYPYTPDTPDSASPIFMPHLNLMEKGLLF